MSRTIRRSRSITTHHTTWLLALVAAGCGATETPPPRPTPKKEAPAEAAQAPVVSPARWSFHPATPAAASATLVLEDGSCILTTDEGLRFRAEPAEKTKGICRGKTTPAPDVAPERLVGIVPMKSGAFWFVGASGDLYEAEGPIAPLRRVIPAPKTFSRVAGGGGVVLATTVTGEIYRLEEGSTWTRVPFPASFALDVAVNNEGHALALGLPEQLFVSDDGRDFKPADGDGAFKLGLRSLDTASEGKIRAHGLGGTITWSPNEKPAFVRTLAATASEPALLELEPTIVPMASSVMENRAALDGDRYMEVVAGEDNGDFFLAQGPLEGPLSKTPLPGTANCNSMKLGMRGKHVFTGCMLMKDSGEAVIQIRASHDGGAHFGDTLELFYVNELLDIAVSSEGTALIAGACKVLSSTSGCEGTTPIIVRAAGPTLEAALSVAPPLSTPPLVPAFSSDGRSAYFIARRAKDYRLTLYVSHDAGATFAERMLDTQQDHPTRREIDDVNERGEDAIDETVELGETTTLQPGDDGTVGIVLTNSRGLVYVTTDEDGRSQSIGRPPVDGALLGGWGRNVLAVSYWRDSPEVSADEATGAWESLDGGSSFGEISKDIVAGELASAPSAMVCSSHGCLVGSTLSRIGWGGQEGTPRLVLPRQTKPTKTRSALTPLVCELDPRAPWTRIDDIDAVNAYGFPGADQLARGRAVWSVLSVDPRTKAITETIALLPEREGGEIKVTTRSLLGPASGEVAMDVSHQMEGYAVVRARIPADTAPKGPMRDVEVAWENFLDGTSGRARIPDAGPWNDADVKRERGEALLDTALISVTPGGIFVRPHAPESDDPRTFLLDAKGKRTSITYPGWSAFVADSNIEVRSDAALVSGRPMAVGTATEDSWGPLTMGLASQAGDGKGPWGAVFTTLAPGISTNAERLARNDWSYLNAFVGAVSVYSVPLEGVAAAFFHPYTSDGTFGAPIALPTPLDLPDVPRPCKADDRRASPRFSARAFTGGEAMYPGRRHPVFISESPQAKGAVSEPMTLLTNGVVLYGSKSSPCVGAYEAFGVARTPFAAVISGDPSRAWVFRRADAPLPKGSPSKPEKRHGPSIEHRPMSCRFDPSAKIPDVIWNEGGTTVSSP